MESTLLDTIESGSRTRNEKGAFEYQSLPQSIMELSYSPPRLGVFNKSWCIGFEGALEFERLNKICKDKDYLLIKTESPEAEFVKTFEELTNPLLAENKELQRTWDEVSAFANTCKAYCIYKAKKGIIRTCFSAGRKQIAWVSCYELIRRHYFYTSRREGLELAENYRTSLLKL